MEVTDLATVAPRPTKAARTRRRILDAAARLFAEKGYSVTTLREIAEAAELRDGSLYYHFGSKDELVDEVTRDGVARATEHIRGAIADLGANSSAAARLRAIIRAHLEALCTLGDYPAAVLNIAQHAPAAIRERQMQQLRLFGEFWTGVISDAQRAGTLPARLSPSVVRDVIFGAMHATVRAGEPGTRSVEEVTDALTELLGLTG